MFVTELSNTTSLISLPLASKICRELQLGTRFSKPETFAKVLGAALTTMEGFGQLSNIALPMLVMPFPMVMVVRPLQSENAELPMVVTLFGIVMLVRLVQ